MAEYAVKKNIRSPRPTTIQHVDKGNFRKPESKSKKDIAEEKSLVTKQNIKEKEKASTKKEKKDLDSNKKKETKTIHSSKGIDVEIKKKPKEKKGSFVEGIKKGAETLKKIFTRNGKAEAAVVGKGGKSPGPKERKKLSEMSAKEKARIAKKKADAKAAATREDARKPKKKEAKKQAETGTRETSYEARVKALVAKKASLSKKETADGRSEYQVQMHKLKKENKKAWKKMFKGGKLKG